MYEILKTENDRINVKRIRLFHELQAANRSQTSLLTSNCILMSAFLGFLNATYVDFCFLVCLSAFLLLAKQAGVRDLGYYIAGWSKQNI